jgi:hypothetical protein
MNGELSGNPIFCMSKENNKIASPVNMPERVDMVLFIDTILFVIDNSEYFSC